MRASLLKIACRATCGLAVTCCLAVAAEAADWGDLTMTFQYDGTAPSPKPINVTKDQAFCGPFNLVDESLVVNMENGGVQNVVVYLNPARGKAPAVHPSYKELEGKPVVVDNQKCRFAPHVGLLWTAQQLVVKNSDTIGHNTNVMTLMNPAQNVIIPASGEQTMKFTQAERLPAAQIACNIHPWMQAWLVVRDHPYMGVSDENGQLTIKNIPAGEWNFQFWHEKSGFVDEVKQDGKTVKWARGRTDIKIKAGANDLGQLKLSPGLFAK